MPASATVQLFVLEFAARHKIAVVPRELFKYRYRDRDIKSLANVPDFCGKASNLNLYLYALRHQVRFTREIFAVLATSKFTHGQKIMLRLRVLWSFGINMLAKYWLSRLHNVLIARSRTTDLSKKLGTDRTTVLVEQWKILAEDLDTNKS